MKEKAVTVERAGYSERGNQQQPPFKQAASRSDLEHSCCDLHGASCQSPLVLLKRTRQILCYLLFLDSFISERFLVQLPILSSLMHHPPSRFVNGGLTTCLLFAGRLEWQDEEEILDYSFTVSIALDDCIRIAVTRTPFSFLLPTKFIRRRPLQRHPLAPAIHAPVFSFHL